MRKALLVCVASSGLALASSAYAQQVGEYDGTTDDGNPVQIIIAQDQLSGKLEIQAVGIGFTLTCKKSGDQKGTGWGIFFADGADIIDGKFSYVLPYTDSYLPFSIVFKGKKDVSGNVALWESDLNPISGYHTPPKKTQLCVSDQPFTGAFKSGPVSLHGTPGTVVIHSGNATTVRSIKNH
jgi:hypothetical protein